MLPRAYNVRTHAGKHGNIFYRLRAEAEGA